MQPRTQLVPLTCRRFWIMTPDHRKRMQLIWWTIRYGTNHNVTLPISSGSADGMACLFVGERPIRWRRMSRGVSYYRQCDCLLKSLFRLTAHKMSKLSIIGPMLGNPPSSVDSPHKGQATREAFWCHRVMMQAYSVDIIRETCAPGSGIRLTFEGFMAGLVVWLDVL